MSKWAYEEAGREIDRLHDKIEELKAELGCQRGLAELAQVKLERNALATVVSALSDRLNRYRAALADALADLALQENWRRFSSAAKLLRAHGIDPGELDQ